MRRPRLELGSQPWQGCILPLNYQREYSIVENEFYKSSFSRQIHKPLKW